MSAVQIGTFVNGQQIEEMVPRVLEEGDHVGIGEHELLFRSYGASSAVGVEDLPTISVSPPAEITYRTRDDQMATLATSGDEFNTRSMENGVPAEVQQAQPVPSSRARARGSTSSSTGGRGSTGTSSCGNQWVSNA